MIRRAAAIVVVLALHPAAVRAQETVLTITAQSADVYNGPSNVTPVIGHVARGTVIPVNRNLGSWVKIAWPSGLNGAGYVHVTMGRIGPPSDAAHPMTTATAATSANTGTSTQTPASTQLNAQPMPRPAIGDRPAPHVQQNVLPAGHGFGVGGLVGYTRTIGASARIWPNNHLGIQLALARNTVTSSFSTDTATSTQFEPGLIYGFFDRITDYVWLRPYVGSSLSFQHQTVSGQVETSSGTGYRLFGGAEFTFAGAPQFGVSADAGYRHVPSPLPGFEPAALSIAIAGHWYVR